MPWKRKDTSELIRKGEQVRLKSDLGDDKLYVVQAGEVDCFKMEGGAKEFWKTFTEDQYFGEFPFLFSLPRNVALAARTTCTLYSLSRELYTFLLKQLAYEKNRAHQALLGKLDFFAVLDPDEQLKVLDAIVEVRLKDGEIALKQNHPLNDFFIVSSGSIAVMINEGRLNR